MTATRGRPPGLARSGPGPAGSRHPLLRNLRATQAGFEARATGRLPGDVKGDTGALILYCLKGRGWCELGGRLHAIRAGDLVALPPGRPHLCSAPASHPWTLHWVRADGAQLPDYLAELGATFDQPVIRAGDDPQVTRLFNEIERALQCPASLGHRLQAAHALGLLLALLLVKRGERARETAGSVQKVAETIIYMSERLHEPLRVAAFARMANLSAPHFAKLFKDQTGCSPRDYLHLLRIHKACQLLRGSSLNVKEISARVGYQDPFHFSRQFKAFEGVSPTAYRETLL